MSNNFAPLTLLHENRLLIMLIGLPGAGKSMAAHQMADLYHGTVFSSDEYRKKLFGDASIQDNHQAVFAALHNDIFTALRNGENVIYDATNVVAKRRIAFLQELDKQKIMCAKVAYVIPCLIEDCIAHDHARDRHVGEEVIKRMEHSFEFPQYFEGWNEIFVHGWEEWYPEYNVSNDIALWKQLDVCQDNPWHFESIGKHSMRVAQIARQKLLTDDRYKYLTNGYGSLMLLAAKYHDVGKLFTRVYDDNNVAHYLSHANVGTYWLLTHLNYVPFAGFPMEDVYFFLFLVNYHMKPKQWHNQKTLNKWEKLLRKTCFDALMLLSECDNESVSEEVRRVANCS